MDWYLELVNDFVKMTRGLIMNPDIWNLIITAVTSTGLSTGIFLLFRDFISRMMFRSIEHRFDKKLEKFKSDVRENEKELEQIRDFITHARRDRESLLQNKRLQAAETLLRARRILSNLSMLVEYMKVFNVPEMMKSRDDEKISLFLKSLVGPLNIDENIQQAGNIDRFNTELYLEKGSLQAFDCYQSIIIHAVMTVKVLGSGVRDKDSLIKKGFLSKKIISAIPSSKEGFDKFGEEYGFYWLEYFYEEILRSLRNEIHGEESMAKDSATVKRLALDTRRAQVDVSKSLAHFGLPDKMLKSAIDTE